MQSNWDLPCQLNALLSQSRNPALDLISTLDLISSAAICAVHTCVVLGIEPRAVAYETRTIPVSHTPGLSVAIRMCLLSPLTFPFAFLIAHSHSPLPTYNFFLALKSRDDPEGTHPSILYMCMHIYTYHSSNPGLS